VQRTCTKCLSAKDISLFHKDTKGKGGYSSACAACRNLGKRGSRIVHKVKIEEICSNENKNDPVPSMGQENIFKKLSEKYRSFYSITVEEGGKCQLQIFKGAPKIVRGEFYNVEELMQKMVASH
jgi:hypothetical protein